MHHHCGYIGEDRIGLFTQEGCARQVSTAQHISIYSIKAFTAYKPTADKHTAYKHAALYGTASWSTSIMCSTRKQLARTELWLIQHSLPHCFVDVVIHEGHSTHRFTRICPYHNISLKYHITRVSFQRRTALALGGYVPRADAGLRKSRGLGL